MRDVGILFVFFVAFISNAQVEVHPPVIIDAEKNQLQNIVHIIQGSEQNKISQERSFNFNSSDNTSDFSGRPNEDCGSNRTVDADEEKLIFAPKNTGCKFKVNMVTPNLSSMLKDGFNLNKEEIFLWQLDFSFLLKDQSNYKIELNVQNEDDKEWIVIEKNKGDNLNIYCGDGDGNKVPLNGGRAIKHTAGGFTDFSLFTVKNDHQIYLKVGNKVFKTKWPHIDLKKSSQFGFEINAKNKSGIQQIRFHSRTVGREEPKDFNNDSDEYTSELNNKVVFLSIANDYNDEGPTSLNSIPTFESEKLIDEYHKKGVTTLTPIRNFKSKSDLKSKLEELQNKLQDADVVFVHYGGHGALVIVEGEDEHPHCLIPLGFNEIPIPYKPDVFSLVPRTDWVIKTIETLMSDNSGTEDKLLHFTIDACSDFIGDNRSSKRTRNGHVENGHVDIAMVDGVYTIKRFAVPDGETASNTNSYSKGLIISLSKKSKTDFVTQEYQNVFQLIGNNKYHEKCYGPGGELGGNQTKILKDFKLKDHFGDYIVKKFGDNK